MGNHRLPQPAGGETAGIVLGPQDRFPSEEFAARRVKIFDAIESDAFAVLQGAPPSRGFEDFRQTNEFYYCCGVEIPQAYLLLDGRQRRTSLYLPHRGDREYDSEGQVLGAEDAEALKQSTGVDEVHGIEALAGHLEEAAVLYTPHGPSDGLATPRYTLLDSNRKSAEDPWDARPAREQWFIGLLRTRFPRAEIRDLTPILDSLRSVKSPREVAVLRRAGSLCALALREAMRSTRPGMLEYQLGAIAGYIYRKHGSRADGYNAIIASGPNAWFGHYSSNDSVMKDGDLVLMDMAPDVGYYTSDIGRMWPVNGVYAPWQRELYGYMVEYHKALLKRIRPGVMADQVMDEAAAEMADVLANTAFSKDIYEAAARRTLEFRGHLSHPVGMVVHDSCDYGSRPLEAGVVFSVDPQMWVPEEKLYIRVEDTIAVTDSGVEVLTSGAPLELDDVERTIRG